MSEELSEEEKIRAKVIHILDSARFTHTHNYHGANCKTCQEYYIDPLVELVKEER